MSAQNLKDVYSAFGKCSLQIVYILDSKYTVFQCNWNWFCISIWPFSQQGNWCEKVKRSQNSEPITLCLNEMHHPEYLLFLCHLLVLLLLVATLSIHSDCGCSYTFDLNLRKNFSSSEWMYSVPVPVQKEMEKSFQNGDISFAKCFATVNWFILFFLPTSTVGISRNGIVT